VFHRKYLNSSAYEVEVLISDHEFVHNGCGMRLTSVAPRTDLRCSRANFQDEDITRGYAGLRKGANTFSCMLNELRTPKSWLPEQYVLLSFTLKSLFFIVLFPKGM